MAKASLQKKIGSVRPPRIQIPYDLESDGAIQKNEVTMAEEKPKKLPGKTKPPTLTLKRGKNQSMEMKAGTGKPQKSAKK
jgi:type VI secretion system protein ImpB